MAIKPPHFNWWENWGFQKMFPLWQKNVMKSRTCLALQWELSPEITVETITIPEGFWCVRGQVPLMYSILLWPQPIMPVGPTHPVLQMRKLRIQEGNRSPEAGWRHGVGQMTLANAWAALKMQSLIESLKLKWQIKSEGGISCSRGAGCNHEISDLLNRHAEGGLGGKETERFTVSSSARERGNCWPPRAWSHDHRSHRSG